MTSNMLQQKLEERILHGLSCEWETALWVLPFDLQKLMKKPLFSLGHHEKQLAYWNPNRREISFSRSFVLNHPWDSIKEVLLHEMAHQFTHEALNVKHERPHGSAFKRSCELLKANPKASGTYKTLSERMLIEDLDENDKIVDKIKKLLALAQSKNIHEAEAAVTKAHQFIEKYNIDLLEHDLERNFVSIFVGKSTLRRFKEDYLLAKLITDHYFVFGIWITSYVISKEKMGRILEISGTHHNVKMASYVYDFIKNQIDMSWNSYNLNKKLNRYHKSDFSSGVIEGFDAKLNDLKKSKQDGIVLQKKNQPVIIEDPRLYEYTTNKYPHMKNVRRNMSSRDQTLITDGKKVGRNIILAQGIEENKKGARLLIP